MIPTDRFLPLPVQRQAAFQPECPVYVHCLRRSIERNNGAVFLQVRMVNCGEREIHTVFLRVEGLNGFGKTCYQVRELPVTNCAAAPRSIFGEDRMLVLPRTEVEDLLVTVERVIFADGSRWRRLPSHRLCTPQEAGYVACACGFPDPPQRERCLLCGKTLQSAPPTDAWTAQSAAPERPAPILRSFTPRFPSYEEEKLDSQGAPRWMLVLLYIFGATAILAAVAFLAFCLTQYGS